MCGVRRRCLAESWRPRRRLGRRPSQTAEAEPAEVCGPYWPRRAGRAGMGTGPPGPGPGRPRAADSDRPRSGIGRAGARRGGKRNRRDRGSGAVTPFRFSSGTAPDAAGFGPACIGSSDYLVLDRQPSGVQDNADARNRNCGSSRRRSDQPPTTRNCPDGNDARVFRMLPTSGPR